MAAKNGTLIQILLIALLVGSSGFIVGFIYIISKEKPRQSDRVLDGGLAMLLLFRNAMSNMKINNISSSMLSPNTSNPSANVNEVHPEIFLKYKENTFSYPSYFNLKEAVNEAISKHTKISEKYTKINAHSFRYIHLPKQCQFPVSGQRRKNMVILVKSFVGNLDLRKLQRSLLNKYNGYRRLKRVFLLGYTNNETLQNRVDTENEIYEDIVQEDFIDAYLNNTFKTVMSYNWVNQYCTAAAILFFMDDDYYVYYQNIIKHIHRVSGHKKYNIFSGTLARAAVPERSNKSVWSMTFDEYPYDLFPPYIGGGAYIVSRDVARKFALSFPYVKYIGIDDVYLGIVAKKLGILPSYDAKFDTTSKSVLAKECSHDPAELAVQNCSIAIRKAMLLIMSKPRTNPRPQPKLNIWLDIFQLIIMLNVVFTVAIWYSNY